MGFSAEGLLGIVEGYKRGQKRRLTEQERREDRAFARNLREAEEERAVSEEGRRGVRHEQGIVTHERGIAREDVTEGREDIQYGRDTETYEHGLERRPIMEGRDDTGYAQEQDDRRLRLMDEEHQRGRRDIKESRTDLEYGQSQADRTQRLSDEERGRKESIEDRARGDVTYKRREEVADLEMTRMRNRIVEEGAVQLVNALSSGVSARIAIEKYNENGVAKIIPESVKFNFNKDNPAESIISFEEDDGDPNDESGHFEGTLGQLHAALGGIGEGDEFGTVSKGGTVYSKRTGQGVFTAPGGDTDTAGNKLFPGGFTQPQARAYEKNVDNLISQAMGGKYDSFTGKYSIPEDNMEMKNMLGDLAGQITRRIIEGQIDTVLTPAEINDAVMSAKDLLLTADGALTQAEKLAAGKTAWLKSEAGEFDNQTKEQWTKAKAETLYLEARAKAEKRIQKRISSRVAAKRKEGGNPKPLQEALRMLEKDPSLRAVFIETYGVEALPK